MEGKLHAHTLTHCTTDVCVCQMPAILPQSLGQFPSLRRQGNHPWWGTGCQLICHAVSACPIIWRYALVKLCDLDEAPQTWNMKKCWKDLLFCQSCWQSLWSIYSIPGFYFLQVLSPSNLSVGSTGLGPLQKHIAQLPWSTSTRGDAEWRDSERERE